MIAEKAVLGSMMKENYLITDANLSAAQFADPVHRMIFQSMKELLASGKAVDFITLLTTFSPQDIGGANYVRDLSDYANIPAFDDYVAVMLDAWREREKRNVLSIAAQENWPIDRIISGLEALLDNRASHYASLTDLLADIYEDPYVKKEIAEGAAAGIGTRQNDGQLQERGTDNHRSPPKHGEIGHHAAYCETRRLEKSAAAHLLA